MSSPIAIDPYEVLGVTRTCDLPTIRAAHRKLALKHHPDRIKDESLRKKGTEEFQKAQQAYEILSDEKRRARYDDQVRLAQLKKEAMMDRGNPLRSTSYTTTQPAAPPRTTTSTAYEYNNGRVYEERRPRYSDEDERYAEPPRTTRKTSAYERRPATAYADDRKKKNSDKVSAMFGTFVDSKLREKAREVRERTARTEAAKTRDRDRRRDSFDKHTRRTAYVEEDSDSDSVTYVPPKRPEPPRQKTYYQEPHRKRHESPPRRRPMQHVVSESSSSESEDDYDSDRDEWFRKHSDAKHYISERSAHGRPGIFRTDSAQYYNLPRERSSGRKSSSDKDDRREDRSRSTKTPRPSESTDTSHRSPRSRRPPPMPSAKSSPPTLKTMAREPPPPQRSATGEYPSDHKRTVPVLNRSSTMPVASNSRKEATSSRSSKLKQSEVHDSGYGSSGPVTPELHGTSPPKNKTTKFFIVTEDPEHSRGTYRTVPAETYAPRRVARSPSPTSRERDRDERREKDKDRERRRPERPTVQTNPSYASTRTYMVSPEQISTRPGMYRTDSSRSTVPRETPPLSRGDSGPRRVYEPSKDDTYRMKPGNIQYTPQLIPENLNKHTRRHASHMRDRDYYPGSDHHDNIHAPKSGRRESIY